MLKTIGRVTYCSRSISNEMKIAICTDMYPPQLGGVADSVVLQARGLRALGHDVKIFAPHMAGETEEPHVIRFPSLELYGGTFCLVFPRGMRARLRDFAPDIVHVHSFGAIGLAASFAATARGIQLVGTSHGSPVDYLRYFFVDFEPFRYLSQKFVSWFYGRCALVTAPASQTLAPLLKYGMKSKTAVVSNAIDCNLFRTLPIKQELKSAMGLTHRTILIYGRIAAEKNLDDALAICADVVARMGAQVVIVGDGPHRAHVERRAKKLGIAERVFFTGRLSGESLVSAINACDVMLTTSLSEAQPMTILQANQCGIPVVGTRAGGVPECIDHGKTGFVIDRDDHKGFVDHLARLLQDDALRETMARNAQAFVSRYSPEHTAREFERLYRSLPGVI